MTMNSTTIKDKIRALDKKVLYGASVITVFTMLAAGYTLLSNRESYASTEKKAEAPVSVKTITVEPKTIDAVVSAAGAVSSKNTSVLSSKIMGKVAALNVQEGDYVSQGRLLVKIESGEISAQAFQAQAAYNNAKLQYDRIKRLFDEEASTQMEMDQAMLGLKTAEAGMNAAKAMESYTKITAPISGRIV